MNTKNNYLEYGKLQPQAIEVEESVLGALLLSPICVDEVMSQLFEDVFYKEQNQRIFSSIKKLWTKNVNIDILTVTDQLKKDGELEIVGGALYVAQLTNRVASVANIEHHSKIIIQQWIRREQINIGSVLISDSYSDDLDVFDTMDTTLVNFNRIQEIITGNKTTLTFSDNIKKSIQELEKREKSAKNNEITGIQTGLTDLDKITNGWQKQELVILAARPGMGKTAMMLHFIKSAAKQGKKIELFSLEMSSTRLTDRLILSENDVNPNEYRSGFIKKESKENILSSLIDMSDYDIHIDDKAASNTNYIKSISRIRKRKYGLDMICIDYLQLMGNNENVKGGNREQEVAKISKECKQIAKELDVPVILLCQLSRQVEQRQGAKRPILSDLRESGSIEQDADMVLFVYRPEYYGIAENSEGDNIENMGELIIAKHREGRLDTVTFRHDGFMSKFYDIDVMANPNTNISNQRYEQANFSDF